MALKQFSVPSGLITASGSAVLLVATTAGALASVTPVIATTGDLSIIAYDSTVAAGVVLYKRQIDSSLEGKGRCESFSFPIVFTKGLTFTITGTAPDGATVAWVPAG